MSTEIEKLGITLHKRMQRVAGGNKELGPEIGTIQSGGGLRVNAVSNTIPKGDYMVNEELSLKAGDRVLVIWCMFEPVVVAVIKDS